MKTMLILTLGLLGAVGHVSAQSNVDASSLRGRPIRNPLNPLDRQGLGWNTVNRNYEPISYAMQSGAATYCAAASASTTTYTCNLTPAISAYTTGLVVAFKPDVNNTASSTININSLGAKTIQKLSSGSLTNLSAGDLDSDYIYLLRYDGTVFIMDSAGSGGTGLSYCAPASASGTTYTCNASPSALTAYSAGQVIAFKPDTNNTGAATVNINSLGAQNIQKLSGGSLTSVIAGDLDSDYVYLLRYTGAVFVADVIATSVFPETSVTGTTHTIATGNCQRFLNFANASGVAVTVPAATGFADGCAIAFKNTGAGDVTFTASGGILLNGVAAGTVTATQGTGGWLFTNGTAWQTIYRRPQCTSGVNCSLDPGTGVESFSATQEGVFITRTDDTSELYKLAKIDSSGQADIVATTDTSGSVGVVTDITAGTATIQQVGIALLTSQGNTTVGEFIGISASTAGTGTSSSSCPSGQVIGIWLQSRVGSGTATALIAPGVCAASGSSATPFRNIRRYSHIFASPTGGDTSAKTAGGFAWVGDSNAGIASAPAYSATANWDDESGAGMTTNATNGHDAGWRQNTAANTTTASLNTIPTGGSFSMRCKFVLGSDVTDMRFYCRFSDGAAASDRIVLAQTNSFGLTLDTGVNANFRLQACEGGSCNYTDTGVAPSNNGRYEFIAVSTASDTWDWYLYANGSLGGSGTSVSITSTPSAAMMASMNIITLEAVAKTFYAQRFEYEKVDR